MANIEFTFPYMSMNDVLKIVKSNDVKILNQQFDNSCSMNIEMRKDILEFVQNKLL